MKIVLATGIYPPEIGGPATYTRALAEELTKKGMEVTVITYGTQQDHNDPWNVIAVAKDGGPFLRWRRYAQALDKHGKIADIVYAFSSISCGVPLLLSTLPKKKKVLRLGGDFFWERYTDRGGKKSLSEWYLKKPLSCLFMEIVLSQFSHIVFSTRFQQKLYEDSYTKLPKHSVIENAIPEIWNPQEHHVRHPFRLLVMSRLVRFKNLESLVEAVALLPSDILLTIVGDGPQKNRLHRLVHKYDLDGRVAFVSSVHGKEKRQLFGMHELMVVPSFTDISPNAALEASSAGLPVLLTKETGLSDELTKCMILAKLRAPEEIVSAVEKIKKDYPSGSMSERIERPWSQIAKEHISLFSSLV